MIFKQQPKALPFLFLTEMWERFGFYVVQGLLVLYMTQYFGYTDSDSFTILGAFTALAYIAPIAGGYLADKTLGFETAIVWGGFFLIIGYILLALPFPKILFYPSLATIVVGTGLFKPNISSLLGTQYEPDDMRRDAGFTIFYIGINIGAFLAGASSGYIKNYLGWRASFAFSSLGLMVGLVTFYFGLAYLKKTNQHIKRTLGTHLRLIANCILAIFALTFLLKIEILARWLLPCVGIALLIFLIALIAQQKDEYRERLFVLTTLIISSIVFWMLYMQLFFSTNLYIDRLIIKNLFGLPLTTTVFYGLVSIYIILLGPLFAWLWNTLHHHEMNPAPITKFVLGIFFVGLSFLTLSISTQFANSQGMIAPLWIFAAYLLITIGELLLSPIGLSAVTTLAPANLVGMMMGIWFVATGFGGFFAGMIAQFANIPDSIQTNAARLVIYHKAFLDFAYLAFFVTIVLFFVRMLLKRLSD